MSEANSKKHRASGLDSTSPKKTKENKSTARGSEKSKLTLKQNKLQNMDILKNLHSLAWCKSGWSQPKIAEESKKLIQKCIKLPKPDLSDDLQEIIEKSKAFPIPFPIDTVRLQSLKQTRPIENLKRNIISTYPLIHERVLLLMANFLVYKREFGTSIEKSLYKDITIPEFINRLMKKRAVTFMGPRDIYKLLSGEKSNGGWETIGTTNQKPPLILENCLSYDEVKLSAMVYVSGYTECINDGDRRNCGVVNENDIEKNAIIMGLIGPRFQRKSCMDYQDILITEEQNTHMNGYGESVNSPKSKGRKLWSDFYNVPNYTYDEFISKNKIEDQSEEEMYMNRYVKKPKTEEIIIFDNESYYKRLIVIAECAMLEAEHRAIDAKKFAYLNIIGCGLGVWKTSPHQLDVYILTFLERIRSFLEKDLLNNVSDINFAYIKPSRKILALFTNAKNKHEKKLFLESKTHPKGGIQVTLEDRNPSAKLPMQHANKLLVLTYAWDGNAQPGNEFWIGKIKSSGDSAAASATQVSELHNAHINRAVNGYNVRVAGAHGLKTLAEYCELLAGKEGMG